MIPRADQADFWGDPIREPQAPAPGGARGSARGPVPITPILRPNMTTLPAFAVGRTDLALPAADIEATASYARNEKAPATHAAYQSDFAMFRERARARASAPCRQAQPRSQPFSPMRLIENPCGITRRCAAIRYAHRLADLEPPTDSEHVRATLRGILRISLPSPTWSVATISPTLWAPHAGTPSARGGRIQVGSSPRAIASGTTCCPSPGSWLVFSRARDVEVHGALMRSPLISRWRDPYGSAILCTI